MKTKIIQILLMSVLLQSCYTYKTIDANLTDKKVGKIYKITENDKTYKGKLISFNDTLTTIKSGKIEQQFSNDKVTNMKVKKFSTLKTVGFVVTTMVVVATVGVLTSLNDMKLGEIKSPN